MVDSLPLRFSAADLVGAHPWRKVDLVPGELERAVRDFGSVRTESSRSSGLGPGAVAARCLVSGRLPAPRRWVLGFKGNR